MPEERLELRLRLDDHAGPAAIARATSELAAALSRTRVIDARVDTRETEPGERADSVPVVGQILLSLAGAAATALVNVISGWLHRTTTSVEISTADGRSVKITGSDLSPERLEELLGIVRGFSAPPIIR
jgi:hypothetical protein